MGRKLFRVVYDLWRKLEFCLERVEKGKNARKLYTSRGVLNKPHTNSYFPVEIELGSFINIGIQFRKNIFCLYPFALIAREIALFTQLLPVGLFFSYFWLQPPVGWSNIHMDVAKKSEILRRYQKTPYFFFWLKLLA